MYHFWYSVGVAPTQSSKTPQLAAQQQYNYSSHSTPIIARMYRGTFTKTQYRSGSSSTPAAPHVSVAVSCDYHITRHEECHELQITVTTSNDCGRGDRATAQGLRRPPPTPPCHRAPHPLRHGREEHLTSNSSAPCKFMCLQGAPQPMDAMPELLKPAH